MTFDQQVLLKVIQDAGFPVAENKSLKDPRAIQLAKRKRYWWLTESGPQWLQLRRGKKLVASLRLGAVSRNLRCRVFTDWRLEIFGGRSPVEEFEMPIAQPDSMNQASTFLKRHI